MQKVFIRNKENGAIRGPLVIDFAREHMQKNNTFHMFQISIDHKTWHDSEQFFRQYAEAILKQTNRLSMSQSIKVNSRIDKYEIRSELGRGGMGIVYRAFDVELERECAIKVLLHEEDAKAKERFSVEARAMASIKHPNIIGVYDIRESPNRYFVMEYIDGRSLEDVLKEDKLSLREKLKIFCQICDGVVFAHNKKLLHRDLKPANILIDKEGVPKILDFGIAKQVSRDSNITKTGDLMGTPKYLAPELLKGNRATYKSDLYALAVILYEMLTGRAPFAGGSVVEVMFAVSTESPIEPTALNPKVSEEMELLCMKCLDKDPKYRLPSVRYLKEEVQRVLDNKPILTKDSSLLYKVEKLIQRYPWVTAAVGGAVVFFFCASLFFGSLWLDARRQTVEAEKKTVKAKKQTQDAEKKAAYALKRERGAKLESMRAHNRAMKAYLHSCTNYIANSRYHKALAQIKETFRSYEVVKKNYGELADTEERDRNYQSANKSMRKAKFYLRYSILPSLPIAKHYTNPQLDSGNIQLSLSPSGKYLVGVDQTTCYLWKKNRVDDRGSIQANDCFMKIDIPMHLQSLAFSDDLRYFLILGSRNLYVYDLHNNKRVFEYNSPARLFPLAKISPNGEHVTFFYRKENILCLLWHHLPTQKTQILDRGLFQYHNQVFSPDSQWFADIRRSDGLLQAKYSIVLHHLNSGKHCRLETHSPPEVAFTKNHLYVSNEDSFFLDTKNPQHIFDKRQKNDNFSGKTTEGKFLITNWGRFYQRDDDFIVKYDNATKSSTNFNIGMVGASFYLHNNFVVATAKESIALWFFESDKLSYRYHGESSDLHYLPKSNVFYTYSKRGIETYRFFNYMKQVDFFAPESVNIPLCLEKTALRRQQDIVIKDSSREFDVLLMKAKKREGAFEKIDIYKEQSAVSNERFVVLLIKGGIAIHDRVEQRNFFLVSIANYKTCTLDGNDLYYIRRSYTGTSIGRLSLKKLKDKKVNKVVGEEFSLKSNGYTKSQMCFTKDHFFINGKSMLLAFDKKTMKPIARCQVGGIHSIAVVNEKIYTATASDLFVFVYKDKQFFPVDKFSIAKWGAGRVNKISVSHHRHHLAILCDSTNRFKRFLLLMTCTKEGKINSVRKIYDGSIRNVQFHPQQDILAIFDLQNIVIYDYVNELQCQHLSGLHLGRITAFDATWQILITELPGSLGMTIVDTKLRKEDYQYYFTKYNLPDIFDE